MAAHRKLTDAQIQWAKAVAAKRQEFERQLALLPTVADMAEELGCTHRYLSMILSGRTARNEVPVNILCRRRSVYNEEQAKQNTRRASMRALMTGKLRREPCRECGAQNTEMHHPDYSQPLNVVWLCHEHHTELHKHQTV